MVYQNKYNFELYGFAMKRQTVRLIALFCIFAFSHAFSANRPHPGERDVQLKVSVLDAAENIPIELARVMIQRNGTVIAQEATNTAGQVRFRGLTSDTYRITAWFIGYATFSDTIQIGHEDTTVTIVLHPQNNQMNEVEVTGERELGTSGIDTKTGNQTFESETYHAPPTSQLTNLIQQSITGAARAPTGEVHIRGQHGEFTYYVDGLPVPLGVFGGLNEVVDSKVIDRATFITGGFPAEYGGQMSAVIDLNNRVPTGSFHLDASLFAGSYLVFNGTKPFSPGPDNPPVLSGSANDESLGGRVGPFRALNSNGQNLSISDHIGKMGFYISGSRQETDRRIDTPTPDIFHDHGFDYFLYGKFDYILSDRDYLTSNLSFSRTFTQVPYDPEIQIASDLQNTTNSFQTLSYFHTISSEANREANLFIGTYFREGGLNYIPGDIDPPNFRFAGDTVNNYLLSEDRKFTTIGVRSTFDQRISYVFLYKIGFNFSSTTGAENFTSRDSLNRQGPSIFTDIAGSDFGIFSEIEWQPFAWSSVEAGVRYDQHIAPDVPLELQVSPRIKWKFSIDENNEAYLYYGKLFMPTNIEGLRSIAQNISNSVTPTFPERDNFYEAVYTHDFLFGLRWKSAAFFKLADPFTDDAALGSSAIKTPFNIATVKTTGIELSLSYSNPATPFSGHLNSSIIHAVGSGELTGGFLPPSNDGPATDLDHDQRISVVVDVNYQPQNWFINTEATYGSGLSNGFPGNVQHYGTGLFDFNQAAHTTPYWIFNFSTGHTFYLERGGAFELSIYVTNILDHIHLIKGAYTTGASWEEPRNVVFKTSFHI